MIGFHWNTKDGPKKFRVIYFPDKAVFNNNVYHKIDFYRAYALTRRSGDSYRKLIQRWRGTEKIRVLQNMIMDLYRYRGWSRELHQVVTAYELVTGPDSEHAMESNEAIIRYAVATFVSDARLTQLSRKRRVA